MADGGGGRFIGPYRVVQQAGKGGTANVFVGEHKDTGARVALKVFAPGSLGYLAPEQILGQPVDGRTDIYQLGMVLIKLATGEEPMDLDAEEKLISAHSLAEIARVRKVPSIRARLPGFPPALDEIVSRC